MYGLVKALSMISISSIGGMVFDLILSISEAISSGSPPPKYCCSMSCHGANFLDSAKSMMSVSSDALDLISC